MIEDQKLFNTLKKLDLRQETEIQKLFDKNGCYSKTGKFPIPALHFELTTHCNAACKHCYNNSGINNIEDKMTPEKWINFTEYLVKNGGVFECILSGGEPLLLGDKLLKIMDILHDDGTCFLLETNGYFINEKIAKYLKKFRYHWLQISIDGVNEEYHDTFRQCKGSWKNAVKGALLVSKNQIPLKIAHCVTPNNIYDIDKMCDFAYSLGASAITIGELCLSGRTSQNLDLLLSIADRKLLSEKISENFIKYKGKMKVKSTNGIKLGLEKRQKKPYASVLIRPNGDIRIDGMAPFVIGNILEDDFMEVWKNKIGSCWKDIRVEKYISEFSDDDRNYRFINFIDDDVYI